jgi:hypothetical protein
MKTFTTAETKIRAMLLDQYGPGTPFFNQLAVARAANRRRSGVRIFVDFTIAEEAACVDQVNIEISKDYRTLLKPPCDIVGFTLFIRKGYLSFLEGYTFGEVKWPTGPMEDWLVIDASADRCSFDCPEP